MQVTDQIEQQQNSFVQNKEILIIDDELFNLQAMMIVLKASASLLGYPPELIDSIVDQELSGTEALR